MCYIGKLLKKGKNFSPPWPLISIWIFEVVFRGMMKDQVFWKSAKLISIIGFCTFPLDGTLGGEVTKMVGFDSK